MLPAKSGDAELRLRLLRQERLGWFLSTSGPCSNRPPDRDPRTPDDTVTSLRTGSGTWRDVRLRNGETYVVCHEGVEKDATLAARSTSSSREQAVLFRIRG